MRRDIEIHINTGDIALISQNKITLRDFRWVNEPALLSRYIYGEIRVPSYISRRTILEQGAYFSIPYTPLYKEIMVCIRRTNEDGSLVKEAVQWYVMQSSVNGASIRNIYASELPAISEDSFYVTFSNSVAKLYASSQSDFNIIKAARQNANCLLACIPGGNYRYPLTGVGLKKWMNSNNSESLKLAETIQSEFNADGVVVRNASYDFSTNQMMLDAINMEE